MPDIQVSVTNKEAVALGSPLIICGNNDYKIHFTFDAEWDDLQVRTARFSYTKDGVPAYIDKPFSGATVDVPVLSGLSLVEVGVYAGDLHTTTGARIPCKRSVLCAGAVPQEEPPADLYNTVLQECNEAIARNEHTKDELVRGGLVENLKETNDGKKFSFWIGTQDEYNAIAKKDANTLYLLTDDQTDEGVLAAIQNLSDRVSAVEENHRWIELYSFDNSEPTDPAERWLVGGVRLIDDFDKYNAFYIELNSGGGHYFGSRKINPKSDTLNFSMSVFNNDSGYVINRYIQLSTGYNDPERVTFDHYAELLQYFDGKVETNYHTNTSGVYITKLYALGGY